MKAAHRTNRRRRTRALSGAITFVVLAVSGPASGQIALPVFWNGGTGNWVEPGGWSPTPLDLDNFFLFYPDNTLSSNYFLVTIGSGRVNLDAPITITSLFLSSGAELNLTGIGSLSLELFGLTGSAAGNDGTIFLSDAAAFRTLSLSGSGELRMRGPVTQVNGLSIHGSGHTIRGEGVINSLFALDALSNQGTIRADVSGKTLRVAGVGLVNSSLLQATDSGRLKIETPLFTNDELVDAAGGTVDIDVSTFTNSDTVRARNGGTVLFSTSTVNASGSLTEVLASSQLRIDGSHLNGGRYRTEGSGFVRFEAGTSHLTGSPTLEGNFLIDTGILHITNAAVGAALATLTATGSTVSLFNASLNSGRYTGPAAGTFTVATTSALSGSTTPATIDSASFLIPSSSALRLSGEIRLDNAGGITFAGTSFNGHSHLLIDGPATLAGNGGFVRFGAPQNLGSHRILSGSDGDLTNGLSTTLLASGAGFRGSVELPFTNHGTVSAENAGFIDLPMIAFANDGLIASSTGGQIQVGRQNQPTLLNNAGGTIRANSTITYSGTVSQIPGVTTVRAGTLDGIGTHINQSRVTLDGATSGPVTLRNTTFLTPGNTRTTLVGTLNFDGGTLRLRDTNNGVGTIDSSLYIVGNSALTGLGTLDFSSFDFGPHNNNVEGDPGATLTLANGITALANSVNDLGTFSVDLINAGHLHATGSGAIRLQNLTTTNTGLIEASSSGSIDISRTQATMTVLNAGGTLRASAGGTVTFSNRVGQIASTTIVRAGTLDGTGTFVSGAGAVLDGLTDGPVTLKNATFLTPGHARTTLIGTLTLDNGTFRLQDSNNGVATIDASLTSQGDILINGVGTLDFSHTGFGPYRNLVDGASTLTLGLGVTTLADSLNDYGEFTLGLANAGRLHATSGGIIRLSNITTTNTGLLEASSTGVLDISRTHSIITVENAGGSLRASLGGNITFADRVSSIGSTAVIRGGTLDGGGTFTNNAFTVLDSLPANPIALRNALFITPGTARTTLLGTLTLDNATFRMVDVNNGSGSLNASFTSSGQTALAGTGTFDFSHATFGPYSNDVDGSDANAQLTLGPGITVLADSAEDVGNFTVNTVNNGLVHATGGGYIQFNNVTTVNSGILQASSNGQLQLGRPNQPTLIDNSLGTVRAAAGGAVTFSGSVFQAPGITTLRGGTLDGTGIFVTGPYAILDGVTSGPITLKASNFRIDTSNELHLAGTLNFDNGTLNIQENRFQLGTPARLIADAPSTLAGTGTVRFLNNIDGNNDETSIETGAHSITIAPGMTVHSDANATGILTGTFTNQGTLHAEGGMFLLQASSFTNTGTVRASAGGAVTAGINGSLFNNTNGAFLAGANTTITFSAPAMTVRAGALQGPGSFVAEGSVLLDGVTDGALTLRDTTLLTRGQSTLRLVGDIALDNATLKLQDHRFQTGTPARLHTDGNATLSGTGTVLFAPNPDGGTAENVIDTPAGSLTLGAGVTLLVQQGAAGGSISGNINNLGTIHAQSAALAIVPGTALANAGIIRASSGAAVDFARANASVTINNAGGLLQADATSAFNIANATNAFITLAGGTLEGTSPSPTPGAGGTFTNARVTFLDGRASPVNLRNASLTASVNTDTVFLGTTHLDNGVLFPLQTRSGLGLNAPVFTANGAVSITGVGLITVGGADGNGFYDHIFSAINGGSWTLGPDVDFIVPAGGVGRINSPMTAGGRVRTDANLQLSGPLTIAPTGTLDGIGIINILAGGVLVNEGLISPGNSPGRLTVNGSLTNTTTSTVLIELAGVTPISGYDVLAVSSRHVLDGQLAIELAPGFVPLPTHSFAILTAGSFSGSFDNIVAGVLTYDRHSFSVLQTPTSLTLTNYAIIPEPASLSLLLLPLAALRRGRR